MDRKLLPPLPTVEELFSSRPPSTTFVPSSHLSSTCPPLPRLDMVDTEHELPPPLPSSPLMDRTSPVPPQPTSPLVDGAFFSTDIQPEVAVQSDNSVKRRHDLKANIPSKKARHDASVTSNVIVLDTDNHVKPSYSGESLEDGEIADESDEDVVCIESSEFEGRPAYLTPFLKWDNKPAAAADQKTSAISLAGHRNFEKNYVVASGSHSKRPTDSTTSSAVKRHDSRHLHSSASHDADNIRKGHGVGDKMVKTTSDSGVKVSDARRSRHRPESQSGASTVHFGRDSSKLEKNSSSAHANPVHKHGKQNVSSDKKHHSGTSTSSSCGSEVRHERVSSGSQKKDEEYKRRHHRQESRTSSTDSAPNSSGMSTPKDVPSPLEPKPPLLKKQIDCDSQLNADSHLTIAGSSVIGAVSGHQTTSASGQVGTKSVSGADNTLGLQRSLSDILGIILKTNNALMKSETANIPVAGFEASGSCPVQALEAGTVSGHLQGAAVFGQLQAVCAGIISNSHSIAGDPRKIDGPARVEHLTPSHPSFCVPSTSEQASQSSSVLGGVTHSHAMSPIVDVATTGVLSSLPAFPVAETSSVFATPVAVSANPELSAVHSFFIPKTFSPAVNISEPVLSTCPQNLSTHSEPANTAVENASVACKSSVTLEQSDCLSNSDSHANSLNESVLCEKENNEKTSCIPISSKSDVLCSDTNSEINIPSSLSSETSLLVSHSGSAESCEEIESPTSISLNTPVNILSSEQSFTSAKSEDCDTGMKHGEVSHGSEETCLEVSVEDDDDDDDAKGLPSGATNNSEIQGMVSLTRDANVMDEMAVDTRGHEYEIIDDLESDMEMDDVAADVSGDSDGESDVGDDEIEAMLEEGMKTSRPCSGAANVSQERSGETSIMDLVPEGDDEYTAPTVRNKIVLVERGQDPFDILPEGWIIVTHLSGMPIYLHKQLRVCCVSRPYFIGPGSARGHSIPISAIPCLQYRLAKANADGSSEQQAIATSAVAGDSNNVGPKAEEADSANSEPSKNVNQAGIEGDTPRPCILSKAKVESVEEHVQRSLKPNEFRDYCERLFDFKTIAVRRFRRWKDRRKHNVLMRKANRPVLLPSTKLITCPLPVDREIASNKRKDFVFNPHGKSYVCILHEYAQHTMRMHPQYKFQELENAETPFSATVLINDVQYGVGYASSKRAAKSEAARITLGILIPGMNKVIDDDTKAKQDLHDLSFFDDIKIEDPRVNELCIKAGQPTPYQVLCECLKRNFGMGDTQVQMEVKSIKHQRSEFTMRVGKHEAKVICKNKREGKQLAAQAVLHLMHPQLSTWGSLLRLYAKSSELKEKKEEEHSVTELQTKAQPNKAILSKLRQEMTKLYHVQDAVKMNVRGTLNFQGPDIQSTELGGVTL